MKMEIKKYGEIIQGSDEWQLLRHETGLTASNFSNIYDKATAADKTIIKFAKKKAIEVLLMHEALDEMKEKDNAFYYQSALEGDISQEQREFIISKIHNIEVFSKDMERGNALEHEARDKYQALIGKVEQVGFYQTKCKVFGFSPDGIVGDDGLIEIKCPRFFDSGVKKKSDSQKFLDWMLGRGDITPYNSQIQGGLLLTGREWCDLVIYNSNMPNHPVIERIERDDKYIVKLEVAMALFKETFLEEKIKNEQIIKNRFSDLNLFNVVNDEMQL